MKNKFNLFLLFTFLLITSCKKDICIPKTKELYLVEYIFTSSSDAADFTISYIDYQGDVQTETNITNTYSYAFNAVSGEHVSFSVTAGQPTADIDLSILLNHIVLRHVYAPASSHLATASASVILP